MPITNTVVLQSSVDGNNKVRASVVRSDKERLVVAVTVGYGYGYPSNAIGMVWDPTGDNQPMTLLKSQQRELTTMYVYELRNPTSVKTGDVELTLDGATTDSVIFMIRGITGLDSNVAARLAVGFSGHLYSVTSPISHAINSVEGDMVLSFFSYRYSEDSMAYGAGQVNQTKTGLAASTNYALLSSTKPGAAEVTMSYATTNTDGAYPYAHVLISFAPAAAEVPGAPTIGVATAGNASASVPFTAPASNGGSAVLDYTALSSLGESVTVTASPAVFSNLSAVARTFTVKARNLTGLSPASAASNSVTPTVNAAPQLTGTVANITGTGGTAIVADNVAAAFTDTGDTLQYTKSPDGTAWPTGLNLDLNTGARSGTVATSTTAGCKVRATDSAGQAIDSNAFSVTIAAPASTVTGVVITPDAVTVAGGATTQLTGVVNGSGGPSQTINYSAPYGSVSPTGLVTAPAAGNSALTYNVTGVSAQTNSFSDTVAITVPALASQTFTIPQVLKYAAVNGATPRANQAVHALVFSMDETPVFLGKKTGLTTSALGICPPFQLQGFSTATDYRVDIVSDTNKKDFAATVVRPT